MLFLATSVFVSSDYGFAHPITRCPNRPILSVPMCLFGEVFFVAFAHSLRPLRLKAFLRDLCGTSPRPSRLEAFLSTRHSQLISINAKPPDTLRTYAPLSGA